MKDADELADLAAHRADILANTISQPDDAVAMVKRWGPVLDRLNANLDRLQDRVTREIEWIEYQKREDERNDHD